jgi:hypothetical protein
MSGYGPQRTSERDDRRGSARGHYRPPARSWLTGGVRDPSSAGDPKEGEAGDLHCGSVRRAWTGNPTGEGQPERRSSRKRGPAPWTARRSSRRRDAAVERREARPARVMGWVISCASGDGSDREAGHPGAAYPHQRLSALCPLILSGRKKLVRRSPEGEGGTRGSPEPPPTRAHRVGCLTSESGN